MPPETRQTARPETPTGSPPRPGIRSENANSSLLVHLEMHLELRVGEVDAEPELVLHRLADDGRELVRGESPTLVAPAGADRERHARVAAKQVDSRRARGFGRLLEHERRVEEIYAEDVSRALDELVRGRRREHGQHAASLAELERAEVAQQPLDVPAQLCVEEHAVPSLQHDLAELQEDAGVHVG